MRTAFVLSILLALVPGVSGAEPLRLEFDAEASEISFVLGATLHSVHGIFQLNRGTIVFNQDTGEASGEIVVDARSGNSDNDKRDRDMHRKVLESETHPDFVFRPDRIDGAIPSSGTTTVTVRGVMTVHGVDHLMEVPVTVTVDGDSVQVTAEFVVPYVEWGLKNPSKLLLRVSKEVEVTVDASGTLASIGDAADSPEKP
jgi:polyisoprenoid-binding protein YceI